MVQITNLAQGPRGFNVKGADGKASAIQPVMIMPGETKDLDLHDIDHPVVQGWIDSGDIKIGAPEAGDKLKEPAPGPDFDRMPDETLRAYIEDRMGNGAKLDGKIGRPALIAKAKAMSGAR